MNDPKHDAAWHGPMPHLSSHSTGTYATGGNPMTARPKPTAADVLAEHAPYTEDDMLAGCRCGWLRGGNRRLYPTLGEFAQHQADMLAVARLIGGPVGVYKWFTAAGLAEHDAQVLRAWGESLLGRYPEDVFVPPSRDAYNRVHRARGATGVSLDALSADAMRRAARLAIQDADRIAGGAT